MNRPLKPHEWIGTIVVIFGIAGGSIFYTDYAEHRLAEEAARNVAGDAAVLAVVEAPWSGPRRTLWCATLERPEGLVAIVTRHGKMPFFEQVVEVAPAWVRLQTSYENRMLQACRDDLALGPAALP